MQRNRELRWKYTGETKHLTEKQALDSSKPEAKYVGWDWITRRISQ